MVVANSLQTRHHRVVLVTPDEIQEIALTREDVHAGIVTVYWYMFLFIVIFFKTNLLFDYQYNLLYFDWSNIYCIIIFEE